MPKEKEFGRVRPKQRSVQSIARALNVLKCFSVETPELGVTEIANRLEYPKSTVHRILATFANEGIVHQMASGRYSPSWRLFAIGAAVKEHGGIHQRIVDALQSLVRYTGETAHLAILNGLDVLYIEKFESSRSLRISTRVGMQVPAHCTALGKMLLAGLDEPALLRTIYSRPLEAFTRNTMTDPDLLRGEITKIREQGYAVDHQECEEGLVCIAAPVVDEDGITCGALSVSGPLTRVFDHLEECVSAVKEVASSLSHDLGADATLLRDACSAHSVYDLHAPVVWAGDDPGNIDQPMMPISPGQS